MSDTIAAFATPPGIGGVAVLRVSGPDAERILRAAFGKRMISHRLTHGALIDPETGEAIDECMAVLMRAPRSFTREDVAEIHCHGGVAVMDRALRVVIRQGARPAEPGEFTRRAFENGRIDLAQAEAVMRLIGARGEAAARAALRQMRGGVSRFVKEAAAELVDMLAGIEAAIDFPDEVEEWETAARIADLTGKLAHKLEEASDPRAGRVLDDGLDVAITGPPNAGKSSLLNALLAEDRAIVHESPGTTRDVLFAEAQVAGMRVRLSDAAGLRDTDDPVESIGVSRARERLDQADLVIMVVDASVPEVPILPRVARDRLIIALNKNDLRAALDGSMLGAGSPCLSVSAATGDGLDALRSLIAERAAALAPESAILTGARHAGAALNAARSLRDARASLLDESLRGAALDLAAIDLKDALRELSLVTGEDASESVVNRVFSTFCVGK
ncbi:MAG: tRNA uridine-5-carboxymethylaminomethyl(34) synthesis GTPase MnmE [Oscillospiraceae bacterium]|jgi:tRNA modification GTPase|nr:tRNA uridine-5-carboxymethylaminomethyl(34) synthesis GTPase MnmE [Oscillospiraceae bacterium]